MHEYSLHPSERTNLKGENIPQGHFGIAFNDLAGVFLEEREHLYIAGDQVRTLLGVVAETVHESDDDHDD